MTQQTYHQTAEIRAIFFSLLLELGMQEVILLSHFLLVLILPFPDFVR